MKKKIQKGGILFVEEAMILNDIGGSTMLPQGRYRIKVESTFYDEETGIRIIGHLTEKLDIERARREGTTGFKPEYFKSNGYHKGVYQKMKKKFNEFNPAKVYAGEFDVI